MSLFNQYKNKDISKHQINLIDIEQNKDSIDENPRNTSFS